MDILARYTSSIFQDFEYYLRTEVDLVQDYIRLDLDDYNSVFITCDLQPGIYSFKALSEVLLRNLQSEYEGFNNTVDFENDNISMKTRLVVRSGIIGMRFEEKSFFTSILGFNPHWDCKHYVENNSQKNTNLSTVDKFHLKCDVIYGSV